MPEKKASLLQFRKRKDQKAIAKAEKTGGDVIIRSKGKISDPTGGKKPLERGTKIIMQRKAPTAPTASKLKTTVTPGMDRKTTKTYIKGDFNPDYVHDRETTPALIKKLKEDPEKGGARMKAQSEGKTSYIFRGKHEYSGRNQRVHEDTPKLDVKVGKVDITPGSNATSHTKVIRPKPVKDGAKTPPARKLPRAKWLTNKESKGYTKGEKRRKKTQAGYGH